MDYIYLADFRRYEVAQSVEPLNVRLEVSGFLHIFEGCF